MNHSTLAFIKDALRVSPLSKRLYGLTLDWLLTARMKEYTPDFTNIKLAMEIENFVKSRPDLKHHMHHSGYVLYPARIDYKAVAEALIKDCLEKNTVGEFFNPATKQMCELIDTNERLRANVADLIGRRAWRRKRLAFVLECYKSVGFGFNFYPRIETRFVDWSQVADYYKTRIYERRRD